MNKGNSSFVCCCWSPETMTADHQRHPSVEREPEKKGSVQYIYD